MKRAELTFKIGDRTHYVPVSVNGKSPLEAFEIAVEQIRANLEADEFEVVEEVVDAKTVACDAEELPFSLRQDHFNRCGKAIKAKLEDSSASLPDPTFYQLKPRFWILFRSSDGKEPEAGYQTFSRFQDIEPLVRVHSLEAGKANKVDGRLSVFIGVPAKQDIYSVICGAGLRVEPKQKQ